MLTPDRQLTPATGSAVGDNDIVLLKFTSRLRTKTFISALQHFCTVVTQSALAAAGAPKGEYEPEVSTIIPRLKDANSAEAVRRIVHQEFLHWFDGEGMAGPESAYSGVAQEIWETFMARH